MQPVYPCGPYPAASPHPTLSSSPYQPSIDPGTDSEEDEPKPEHQSELLWKVILNIISLSKVLAKLFWNVVHPQLLPEI